MASRRLTDAEKALARQVFEDKLPYEKIHIANYYLPGNQGVPVTLASVGSLIRTPKRRNYTIYWADAYQDGGDAPQHRVIFVHELTHVWQGYHRRHAWEYMLDSMLSQGHAIITTGNRSNAYTYDRGGRWDGYNVEQQAHIVQDWFARGMPTGDDDVDRLFPYIRDHVRAGRN